eukprot:gene14490-biopygen8290
MFVCNYCGFLPAAAQEPAERVSVWLTEELTHCASNVAAQRGVVELISADHTFASFGAVHHIGAHRQAAVRAAMGVTRRDELMTEAGRVARERALGALAKLPIISAACSGQALCGDFGGTAQLRFMEIGGVSSLIAAMERLATRWGVSALVDDAVHLDASTGWDCRLREQVVYAKRGDDRPLLLWQVAGERGEGDTADGAADEWMYSLAAQPPNPWAEYNEAVRWWIAGRSSDARRRAAEAADGAAGGVRDALAALRERIRDGPMPITIVEEVVATALGARSRPADIPAILHYLRSERHCRG